MSKSNITNDLSKARTRADLIQNETQEGKNDHERVGQGLNYILDCIQDNANDIAALEDGGTSGGGNVIVTSYYPNTGEHIADISVGGVSNGIYAPKPGTPNLSSPLKEINNLNRQPSSANKILVSTASGGWEYQDKPTGGGGGGDITNVRYDNEIADLSTAQKVGTLYVSSGNVSSPYSVYAPKGGTVDFNGIQKNYFTNVLHGTTPDTPQGINKGYVADGDYFFYNGNYWYKENVNPTDQQDTWMLIVWFNTNGTIDSMSKVKVFDSSTGGRLNGRDGQEIEWIYMLCDEELSEGTHGTYEAMENFLINCKGDAIGKTKTGESAPFTQEDVMPDLTGHATLGSYTWTDNPTGISADHKYEYASFRVSGINSTGVRQWGDTGFAAPFVWSKWGDRGMDGDGVEYIFWVSKTGGRPSSSNVYDYPPAWIDLGIRDSQGRQFTDAEYLGPYLNSSDCSHWSDNPIDMDDDTDYPEGAKQWVSVRKLRRLNDSEEGTWGTFSEPALWNYKARNGVANGYIVDLTNEMLPVGTDETGAIASWSNWSRVQVYHNGLKMTYTSGTPTVGSNNFTYEVDEQNIEWATGAAGNINITTNDADITVGLSNVTGLNEKSIMIPIIVTVPGIEANTTTTINKNLIIQGIATGEAGQTVDMYVDADSIIASYDGGNVVPNKVNFGVRIGRGDDIATYPAEGGSAWNMGYYFKYTYFVNNSGTPSTGDHVTSISPVARPGTDKNTLYYYKVDMYKRFGNGVDSNNDKLVDTETIPIIREAAPGIGIDAINYNINAIGTTLTVDPTTGNVTGKLNFKLTKTEGANTTKLESLIYHDETLKQYEWGNNAYFTVKVGGANAGVSIIENSDIFEAKPVAWHNSGDGWDPANNPYTQIIVYTAGGTPVASLVVPFIKQGEKGSDAQVQALGGVVIRYRDWSNLNGDNCGDVGIGVVPSDKDSIVYKDIILYNDNYYYLKPSYAQAPPPNGLNGDCSVSNVKDTAGTPSTSSNAWMKVEPYEDAMFQFLMAKYAYIENLTAKHVIITNGGQPVAGITSGTSVPSIIEGFDGLESVRFWAGLTDNNLWNSKFLVTQYGQLKATNADISGTIRANAVYNPVYEVSEDLTINPSIHGRSFMFSGASSCTITLPRAIEYQGLELQFYVPFFTRSTGGLAIQTTTDSGDYIYFSEGTTLLNRTLATDYHKVNAYNNNLITIKSLPLDPYGRGLYNWVVVSGDVSGAPA